jgi:hypothetical protein
MNPITTDPRKLRDIIADQCEAKELSPFEVAKRSGINEQYVDALISGDISKLPAFPYIRGGLISLAGLLGLPAELLVNKYREEFMQMRSGSGDKLPGNRFALPSYRREYLIGAGVLGILSLIFWISQSGFFGQPALSIITPPAQPSPFIVSTSTYLLSGRIDPGDILSINGQHSPVQSDGTFKKEIQLIPEINVIEFTTKRFLGREIKEVRQIYLDIQSASSTASSLLKETGSSTQQGLDEGSSQ